MRISRVTLAMALVLGVVLVAVLANGCAAPANNSGTTGTTTQTTTGTPGSSTGTQTTIMESNFAFNPDTVQVPVGTVVSFVNQDSVDHHIVVGTKDLGVQKPGQTVSWTADVAAVYPMRCMIHPSMVGQITVGTGVQNGNSGTGGSGGSNGGQTGTGNSGSGGSGGTGTGGSTGGGGNY